MNKITLWAIYLAFFSTVGAVHAAQVIDESCAYENNGTYGETESHQNVICSNEKWQDVNSLSLANVQLTKLMSNKEGLKATFRTGQIVGVRNVIAYGDASANLTIATTVVGFNSDNTAHIVVDLSAPGTKIHIETNVPLNTPTNISAVGDDDSYSISVDRVHS